MKETNILTAVRIVEKRKGLSLTKPKDMNKYLKIENNCVKIDKDGFLKCLLSRCLKKFEETKNEVDAAYEEISQDEVRAYINGHDFLSILLFYLRKKVSDDIKNPEILSQIYKNAVEPSDMRETQLFKDLLSLV